MKINIKTTSTFKVLKFRLTFFCCGRPRRRDGTVILIIQVVSNVCESYNEFRVEMPMGLYFYLICDSFVCMAIFKKRSAILHNDRQQDGIFVSEKD